MLSLCRAVTMPLIAVVKRDRNVNRQPVSGRTGPAAAWALGLFYKDAGRLQGALLEELLALRAANRQRPASTAVRGARPRTDAFQQVRPGLVRSSRAASPCTPLSLARTPAYEFVLWRAGRAPRRSDDPGPSVRSLRLGLMPSVSNTHQ